MGGKDKLLRSAAFRNSGGDGKDGAMPYGYARLYLNDAMWIGPVQE